MSIENERKEFINYLSLHPELLKNISNERLEQILDYYKKENEKKRQKIIELKRILKSS